MNALYSSEIDTACLQLFESLCEHKALLPLAYLLHTWPIPDFTEISLHRLRKTLEALSSFSDSDLTPMNRALCEVLLFKLGSCRRGKATVLMHG